MLPITIYIVAFLVSFFVAIISTPLIKKIAIYIGAVDEPCSRKVHKSVMPRLGGLAIVLGVIAGAMILKPSSPYLLHIMIGGALMVLVGVLDDKYQLSANMKLFGQILAASVVVSSGLTINMINLPFSGELHFGIWSYPFTVLWIIAITNAINLIDGLDGLAAGTSTIALITILTMAILDNQVVVVALAVILIGSTMGFLIFNFYPAKIFMGDTGSLFLGYSISVISMLGLFKNLTLFSLVIPIIILAIPIFDTLFAIVRRVLNKRKISAPDKAHLHYCLLNMGFSHRKTVLIIYTVSAFFGVAAIIFSATTLWASFVLIGLLLLGIQIGAEVIGILGTKKRPLLNFLARISLVKKVLKTKSH